MKKKSLFLLSFIFVLFSCHKDKNTREYYTLHGPDRLVDTIYDSSLEGYSDTTLAIIRELKRIQEDSTYIPDISDLFGKAKENDTIWDDQGKPVEVKLKDSFYGASKQILTYDDKGRLQQILGTDDNGNTREFLMNVAITTFKYDDRDNIIEERNYQPNGELITAEFELTPVIRQYYDDQNRLREIWYLNEKEELKREFGILKLDYEDGKEIVRGWFNKDGLKRDD